VGGSAEIWVTPGKTVVSLVSEDLATHPELAERTLAAGEEHGPRLVRHGVAAPVVRLLTSEEDMPCLIAKLHAALLPGSPDEIVE
jgi:hypothetical protein